MAIALEYATTLGGLFTRADMRVFGQFVIKLALPAMLFNALSQRQIGEILHLGYVLAYLAGTLTLLGLCLLWGKRSGLSATDSVVAAMGMTCSNSSFVGYPILLLIVAPVAAVALALNALVENLLVIPLLLALAERSRGEGGHWTVVVGQSLKRLAVNPVIIALVAGLLASVMRWQLPEPVVRAVNLFALCSTAYPCLLLAARWWACHRGAWGGRSCRLRLANWCCTRWRCWLRRWLCHGLVWPRWSHNCVCPLC